MEPVCARAEDQTRPLGSQGLGAEPEVNKQPPTLSTPGLPHLPRPVGGRHWEGTSAGTCQTLGMTEPEEASPSLRPPGPVIRAIDKEQDSCWSWQVSRSLPKLGAEATHRGITATLTAAQILGRQFQLHPHRAKVSAAHLGDWQEGLSGCSAKDGFSTCSWIQNRFPQPEIGNRVRAGKPVFHHP